MTKGKRVTTPLGTFASVQLAAEANRISRITARRRACSQQKGWYFVDEEFNQGRQVTTPLGTFASIGQAAKAHGITHSAVAYRAHMRRDGYYFTDDSRGPRLLPRSMRPRMDQVVSVMPIGEILTANQVADRLKNRYPLENKKLYYYRQIAYSELSYMTKLNIVRHIDARYMRIAP